MKKFDKFDFGANCKLGRKKKEMKEKEIASNL